MSSTAHEDQFTDAPEPVHHPYSTADILRRNVADLELALKQQTERAEAAEAELERLREQKPVAWDCGGSITANSGYAEWFSRKDHGAAVPLYTSPVPAPAVPRKYHEFAGVMLDAQPFITAETYGGRYIVAMRFERLGKMQDCHAALLALLQSAVVRHSDTTGLTTDVPAPEFRTSTIDNGV